MIHPTVEVTSPEDLRHKFLAYLLAQRTITSNKHTAATIAEMERFWESIIIIQKDQPNA